jgi:phage terminase large subunit-like protein
MERKYRWSLHARPQQIPPPGDWAYWLILAGRGFGKTRTGAELVRAWARDFRFVNLIGATSDDARDIMIEGESGILSICPASERPVYKKSERKLSWPNGATSLIFTADEPDRLRGKQHEKLWCLVGDTRVLMADGREKTIKTIRVGDLVQTQMGPRRVTGHALTKRNAELMQLTTVGRQSIIGTASHPVWVDGRGFIPLASLKEGMAVCVTSASNGVARLGTAIGMDITSGWCYSIGRFGKRLMGQFLTASKSIISTETRATTGSKIWNFLLTASTALCTSKRRLGLIWKRLAAMRLPQGREIAMREWRVFSNAWCAAASIIVGQSILVGSALASALRRPGLTPSLVNRGFVNTAESHIRRPSGSSAIALNAAISVPQWQESRIAQCGKWLAPNVARSIKAPASMHASAVESVPCVSIQTIASVERLADKADVYDIAVDEACAFFANGIFVHNCDELAAWRYIADSWTQAILGLRLGSKPQAVITTTPRPIKQLKDLLKDPATVVTRGSTFDNRANLAPTFFSQITARYEGTRLGRQELYAEVLEDVEGALWRYSMIEPLRVAKATDMRRILVAIDPAVSANKHSDETGILVAGKGIDGQYYVLADVSGIYSPLEWAHKAMHQHDILNADAIVAEVNNGGDLVEANLSFTSRDRFTTSATWPDSKRR